MVKRYRTGFEFASLSASRGCKVKTALVLCEQSGTWSNELHQRGYRVIQVDLAAETSRQVLPGWDVLKADIRDIKPAQVGPVDVVAAFPPCTMLAGSGAGWWEAKAAAGLMYEALEVLTCAAWWACSARVAGLVENPRGLASRVLGPSTIEVEPWQFSSCRREDFSKRTRLWLYKWPPAFCLWSGYSGRLRSWVRHVGGKSPDYQAQRSLSWQGMAHAYVNVLPAGGETHE